MKKITFSLIALALLTLPLFGGRYAGDFMMIGAGARSLGMGGAFTALANDGSAIYWNSAGLAQLRESELSVMHAFLYGGMAMYDNVTFCQPLPNDVTIAVNATLLSVSEIPYFDERYLIGTNVDQRINNSNYHLPGVPDETFASTDQLYQIAFAKGMHYDANLGWLFFEVPLDFNAGLNFKFIKRYMEGIKKEGLTELKPCRGSGTGIDLGFKVRTDMAVLFDWDELGKLDLGLNFQDISGTNITWDTESEHKDEVLFNTKLGVSVSQPLPALKSELTLSYDYDYVYEGTRHYGAQWSYSDLGSLRAGYYDKNFTCGASVNVYGVGLDYALVTNPVGITNRVGLRVYF